MIMMYGGNEYIRKDNQDCLVVYTTLLKGFHEIKRDIHPYLNIIAIFFQDLMGILTNYVLKLNGVRHISNTEYFNSLPEIRDFPYYINYRDVIRGIDYEKKIYRREKIGRLRFRAVSIGVSVFNKFKLYRALKVGLLPTVPLNRDFKFKFFFEAPLISLPEMYKQMKVLFSCVDKIWEKLCIISSSLGMKKLIEKHIKLYVKNQLNNPFPEIDVFVTSGLTNVSPRIVAALCRSKAIPVVNIFHGESDGLIDEPIFGYAENGFASIVLGYGRLGKQLQRICNFAKPLYEYPHYICGNSEKIKNIYKNSRIEPMGELDGKRIMYVPTSFSGVRYRYGPFRDMPDIMYLKWQEKLIEFFPDLIWKGHPKEKAEADLFPKGIKYILRERLENCFQKSDIFFFDYISSAFYIACATDKPIVYFDIGLRNITSEAYEFIKKRCIVIIVNPESPPNLKEAVINYKNHSFYNELTQKYSLYSEDNRERQEILYEWIAQNISRK